MPIAEPRSLQHQYIRKLHRISYIYQAIVAQWLQPLLTIWPREIVDHDTWVDSLRYHKWPDEDAIIRFDADSPYNPLMPHSRPPSMSNMSDSDIRKLWPNLDPADIRTYAPWASTKTEVIRLVAGNPSNTDLQQYVSRAIISEKGMRPRPPSRETFDPNPPGPGAFIAKPRTYPPVVLGPNGFPMLPPVPVEVTAHVIAEQLGSLEVALTSVSQKTYVTQVLGTTGDKINAHATREVSRVLNINLRKEIPNIQSQIDQWRDINVSLITDMQRSLYVDISRTVESAHIEGTRVEILAQNLIDRYGVNESRAALIARDQTLKLNGQINRSRQQQAGITHYRWVTSRDERVRESHQDLDGTVQSWDAPPSEGHPGSAISCRCTSDPITENIQPIDQEKKVKPARVNERAKKRRMEETKRKAKVQAQKANEKKLAEQRKVKAEQLKAKEQAKAIEQKRKAEEGKRIAKEQALIAKERQAVEQRSKVEQIKLETERKAAEQQRKVTERKAAEQEKRIVAERKKLEAERKKLEVERKAAEQRRIAEQQRKAADEQRKAEEMRRAEQRKREADLRKAEQEHKRIEAQRKVEQQRARDAELKRKTAERKVAEDLKKKSEAAKKKPFIPISGDKVPVKVQTDLARAMKSTDIMEVNLEGMRPLDLFRKTLEGLNKSQIDDVVTKMNRAPFDTPIKIGIDPDPIPGFKAMNLIDGRHRLQAAREFGATRIQARILTYDEAGDIATDTIAIIPTGGNVYDIVTQPNGSRSLVPR